MSFIPQCVALHTSEFFNEGGNIKVGLEYIHFGHKWCKRYEKIQNYPEIELFQHGNESVIIGKLLYKGLRCKKKKRVEKYSDCKSDSPRSLSSFDFVKTK